MPKQKNQKDPGNNAMKLKNKQEILLMSDDFKMLIKLN